jgi:hypothetical protein
MRTKDVVDILIAEHGCRLHSDVGPFPPDVDMYVPQSQFEKATALVKQQGYILTNRHAFQQIFQKFEDGGLFMIDLISNFNFHTRCLPSLELSSTGNEEVGRSTILYKCFKYLCYNRLDKSDYIGQHREELAAFLKDKRNFVWISTQVLRAAKGPLPDLFRAMRKPYDLRRFLTRRVLAPIRLRWNKVGTGYAVAFIGPDGSGKSFFIEKLRPIGVTRTVYMGDWFFAAQTFYNAILKIPSPFNRFIYGFYIVENYSRLVRVFWLRLLGRIVLIDRFPGTGRNIVNGGALAWINRFVFLAFPKPDVLAMLYAPPNVIHKRKQDLSARDIGVTQDRLLTLLAGTRHLVLNTERLDESLNTLLSAFYARLQKV